MLFENNDNTDASDFSRTGLLIAAHGSTSTSGGRTSSRKHAQAIGDTKTFADVRAGFLTEKPFVADVLNDMVCSDIYIVPNLACSGYVTTTKLPTALKLTGNVTERITPKGHQRIVLTQPVGMDPTLPKLMATRIRAALSTLDTSIDDGEIVIIGHGSQKSRSSFEHTNHIAEDIARQNLGLPIITAFLEEEPFVRDWRQRTNAKTVIFVPFLISDGYHGADETPREIGFDAKDPEFQSRLANVENNMLETDGRLLVYMPPIGDVPEMADLIMARIRAAQRALV